MILSIWNFNTEPMNTEPADVVLKLCDVVLNSGGNVTNPCLFFRESSISMDI